MADSRFMWSFSIYVCMYVYIYIYIYIYQIERRHANPVHTHPTSSGFILFTLLSRFIFVVVSFIHIFRMKSVHAFIVFFSCLLRAAPILYFWRHYANNVYRNVKIIQALGSFFLSRITSSLLVQTIIFSILFSVTLNQCSCLRVTDRILHPYEEMFYYSFIDFTFGFLDWALEENSIWTWW